MKINPQNPAEVFVSYALHIGALELLPKGRTLKSGRVSPYFFNSGLFATGESSVNLAVAYASVASEMWAKSGLAFDVVYGPAYKGIPLAATIAGSLYLDHGLNVSFAFNRKEAKGHGEGGLIVGTPLKGKKVLIVDDVMTTGTSSGEAVDIIRSEGGVPVACVIAFDRQERGKEGVLSAVQEFEQNYGIPVRAAATLSNLVDILRRIPAESGDDQIGEMLEMILAYRKQYGV